MLKLNKSGLILPIRYINNIYHNHIYSSLYFTNPLDYNHLRSLKINDLTKMESNNENNYFDD